MIVHSDVESDLIYSEIGRQVSSTIEQDTIYSEELDYTSFDELLRITQAAEPRSINDDKLRILQ